MPYLSISAKSKFNLRTDFLRPTHTQTRPLRQHTLIQTRTGATPPLPSHSIPPLNVEPAFSNQELIVIPRCGCRSRFIHNYQ